MRLVHILLILIFSFGLRAQNLPDTIFSFEEYLNIVEQNHPVLYQADLLREEVSANTLMQRGAFDPKLMADWNEKDFDDKDYYRLINAGLKIPTWFGIEGDIGYSNNEGLFLDDSDNLPQGGLIHAGISVPLARGILLDQRRAGLKQAAIFAQSNEEERKLIINDLLADAALAYQLWQIANQQYNVSLEGLALARIRFEGTVGRFQEGDLPAIDTLESLIIVQSRRQELLQAQLDLQNARIKMENFLWLKGSVPMELSDEMRPETWNPYWNDFLISQDINSLQTLIDRHPLVRLTQLKLDALEIERRLAIEDLKPDIRLKYQPLIQPTGNNFGFNPNDFTWGLSVNYPLFLRKERGKLRLNKVKNEQTTQDLALKTRELEIKSNTIINDIRTLEDQIVLNEDLTEQYRRLLLAENQKFNLGESSVFLVNSRETKYLEIQRKTIDLRQKLNESYYQFFLEMVAVSEALN